MTHPFLHTFQLVSAPHPFASLHYPDLLLHLHSPGSENPLLTCLFTVLTYLSLCAIQEVSAFCMPTFFLSVTQPLMLLECESLSLTYILLYADLHLLLCSLDCKSLACLLLLF